MATLIRRQGVWPKLLASILVAMTLAWTAWLLRDAIDIDSLRSIDPNWTLLGASMLTLAVSLWLSFLSHAHMIKAMTGKSPGLRKLADLHFVAQMMKHLPGRLLGIAYQAVSARDIASPLQWTALNITYMLLTMGAAFFISVFVLSALGVFPAMAGWGVLLIAILTWLVARSMPVNRIVNSPRWKNTLPSALQSLGRIQEANAWPVILQWYATSWLVYLAAWAFFGAALGESFRVGIELCALYTLAWLLGFISLITPSGLGIRELAFVMLASKYPADLLASVAIMMRIGLLVMDVLLGMFFLLWNRLR